MIKTGRTIFKAFLIDDDGAVVADGSVTIGWGPGAAVVTDGSVMIGWVSGAVVVSFAEKVVVSFDGKLVVTFVGKLVVTFVEEVVVSFWHKTPTLRKTIKITATCFSIIKILFDHCPCLWCCKNN